MKVVNMFKEDLSRLNNGVDNEFLNFEVEELIDIVDNAVMPEIVWKGFQGVETRVGGNVIVKTRVFADKKEHPVVYVDVVATLGELIDRCYFEIVPFGCLDMIGDTRITNDKMKLITKEVKRLMLDRIGEPYKIANNEFYEAKSKAECEEADIICKRQKDQAKYDCSYNSYTI